MDFPQEIGVLGRRGTWAAQSDPQDSLPDLISGGSVNTPTCVEVQPTSELVHFMQLQQKQLKTVCATSAYSVSSKQSHPARAVAIFWIMLTLFCDKLYA